MYEFHSDKDRYFDMQYRVAKEFILPFIRQHVPVKPFNRVLEIGCAEAGVLKCFLEEGAFCTGIEMSESRIGSAEKYHAQALKDGRIEFVNRNVFDIDPDNDLGGRYDLVILKDVIEHIPGQREFIHHLQSFLNEDGLVFFAFPPWQMPFGGHQQIAKNRLLSHTPYFHLLPMSMYRLLLRLFGESRQTLNELTEIKETGISIERLERYLKSA
ncbi:MAG TPA: methyltransferase domain-containing protein, partial [Saprospiraceae bacterium]|nr:methyltransferase domain-containing protein [Saprospiraceae bacterium]